MADHVAPIPEATNNSTTHMRRSSTTHIQLFNPVVATHLMVTLVISNHMGTVLISNLVAIRLAISAQLILTNKRLQKLSRLLVRRDC